METHLRHNLQLLPLPNIPALADSSLKLLDDLPIQRRSAGDRHLHLPARGSHDDTKLLAHALEHRQPVVLGQGVEEVLDRVGLVLHGNCLLELGDDGFLVGDAEGGRGQDRLQAGVFAEGAGEVVEGFGDGVEGLRLCCCRVLV